MAGATGCQGAALMQIVAQGLADAVLTGMPSATFFRFQSKAYTNFALEVHIQDFNAGVPNFGSQPKINIDRVGDLVYFMYILAEIPGIGLPYVVSASQTIILGNPGTPAQGLEPYWTQDVGQALIEKTSVYIGGQCIDEIHSEFLYIWEELSGQPGKHLKEMTGNFYSAVALQMASKQPRNLYIPLPFWFTLNSGNALPLVSLQFHSFQVQIAIRQYQKLLKLPYATMQAPYNYTLSDIEKRPLFNPVYTYDVQPASALSKLTSSDLLAKVIVCYVYLDQRERSQFADGQFETLINQHQFQETSVNQTVSATNAYGSSDMWNTLELTFNHPVFELYWVARLGIHEDFLTADIPEYNEWFNFKGPLDTVNLLHIDPFKEAQLKLNNSNRWPQIECRYFRLVEPWQYHTNIVNHNMIYSYSFSLQPEDVQPAGSCNFSRIDNACIQFKVDRRCFIGPQNSQVAPSATNPSPNSHVSILVLCQNYNILRFKYGLGGLRFAA
jgi:hypothetical protein